MIYTIYKTTNNINGKIYYGAHKTKNQNDSYMGSGRAIKNAIKKYGKENFSKEIIFCALSEKLMYEIEKEIITQDVVNSKETYNETLGGFGGWSHFDSRGDKNCMRRKDVANRVSVSLKNKFNSDKQYAKKLRENAKRATLASTKIRKGSKDSEETKMKRAASLSKTVRSKAKKYLLISPSGERFKYATISECVEIHDLNRNILKNWINKGTILKSQRTTRFSDSANNTYGWELLKVDKL